MSRKRLLNICCYLLEVMLTDMGMAVVPREAQVMGTITIGVTKISKH